ncbi:hypothetical protein PsYK624_131210 [Phanerochaete sordida]|uniref:Uncharacterized protein n=1 Tax=Phanerochaete sordida TaxID=48140 RepID=A0A9P3LJ54_9APHY|nr:hypothetical protein PsYK624_131210 [Phanerochaete sordida]
MSQTSARETCNENEGRACAEISLKWDAIITPDAYTPLTDANHLECGDLTPATANAFLPDVAPSPPPFSSFALRPATLFQRRFGKQDLVNRVIKDCDPCIVPTAAHGGDRRELRHWIPTEYLKDGALTLEGLYIANALTCVRVSAQVTDRNRRDGIVVVPPGHEDFRDARDKDMWCLLCPEVITYRENGRERAWNPRIGKLDRHAAQDLLRTSIAHALDIAVSDLPEGTLYFCPSFQHPKCTHKQGGGRADAVAEHTNKACNANPHPDYNWRAHGPT